MDATTHEILELGLLFVGFFLGLIIFVVGIMAIFTSNKNDENPNDQHSDLN